MEFGIAGHVAPFTTIRLVVEEHFAVLVGAGVGETGVGIPLRKDGIGPLESTIDTVAELGSRILGNAREARALQLLRLLQPGQFDECRKDVDARKKCF